MLRIAEWRWVWRGKVSALGKYFEEFFPMCSNSHFVVSWWWIPHVKESPISDILIIAMHPNISTWCNFTYNIKSYTLSMPFLFSSSSAFKVMNLHVFLLGSITFEALPPSCLSSGRDISWEKSLGWSRYVRGTIKSIYTIKRTYESCSQASIYTLKCWSMWVTSFIELRQQR